MPNAASRRPRKALWTRHQRVAHPLEHFSQQRTEVRRAELHVVRTSPSNFHTCPPSTQKKTTRTECFSQEGRSVSCITVKSNVSGDRADWRVQQKPQLGDSSSTCARLISDGYLHRHVRLHWHRRRKHRMFALREIHIISVSAERLLLQTH